MINTIDPLGGSWFVEEMTRRMVDGAFDYFRRIDEYGGMVEAIEAGFPQRELMDAAFAYQRAFEEKEKTIVGLNAFQISNEEPIDILYIADDLADRQVAFLNDGQGAARRGGRLPHAGRPEDGSGGDGEHHAADPGLREGLLHGGRDQRRPARRLQHLRGARGLLTRHLCQPRQGPSAIFSSTCCGRTATRWRPPAG